MYPKYPDTYWSFKHTLKFILRKANFPPLGLLTVAAMLPDEWAKRLVNMNVTPLTNDDIEWADYVFISAMVVQRSSAVEVIKRAKRLGTKIVAGGPLFTTEPEQFEEVDYLVLNEAEITLPLFLSDLAKGTPQHIYATSEHPNITNTPIPLWSLINMNKYYSMSLQYSRGCPFNCEFCVITVLDGHFPRTKSKEQILAEFDSLYDIGWRGSIFIVDDNLIGNKNKLKTEILPALIEWQAKKNYPFALLAEASINLADDRKLMQLMVKAGFSRVFVGIETPSEASLTECGKSQNTNRDLIASIKTLQSNGFDVMGGFIVGFDSDTTSIFDTQINFIQKSGIVAAMVDLLEAPRGSRLHQRLKSENRLVDGSSTGDYTNLNFVPKMDPELLISGYKRILDTIYLSKNYYDRIKIFLQQYNPKTKVGLSQFQYHMIFGIITSIWFLGVLEKGRVYYWKLFAYTLATHIRSFPVFVTLTMYGYHFRRVTSKIEQDRKEVNNMAELTKLELIFIEEYKTKRTVLFKEQPGDQSYSDEGVALDTLYVKKQALELIGNPGKIKVTIEPAR